MKDNIRQLKPSKQEVRKKCLKEADIPDNIISILLEEKEIKTLDEICWIWESGLNELKATALIKAEELIKTFDDTLFVFERSSDELETLTLTKAVEFIKNIDHICLLWIELECDCAMFDNKEEKNILKKRVLVKADELMKTPEKAREIWENCSGELGSLALKFMTSL